MKRGARPSPRHILARAKPHIALPAVPPNFLYFPKQLSVWGNDVHGDCVSAEEAFAKACNSPEIFITDDVLIAWAAANGFLEGADLTPVMDAMIQNGFDENNNLYDDGPPYSVDWTDPATLQSAICHGPVKLGIAADQLQTACEVTNYQTGWFATGFQPDSDEDHCVSLCGYGTIQWLANQLGCKVPDGIDPTEVAYAMFTWGSIGIIDFNSLKAITGEAWLRQPTTIIIPATS